jgi:hypothetical protein
MPHPSESEPQVPNISPRPRYAKGYTNDTPGAIIILIDYSSSMFTEKLGGCRRVDKALEELNDLVWSLCEKAGGKGDTFVLTALKYTSISDADQGLQIDTLIPWRWASELRDVFLDVDGARIGGFSAKSDAAGHSTPTSQALDHVAARISNFLKDPKQPKVLSPDGGSKFRDSMPPTIYHITDGEPNDFQKRPDGTYGDGAETLASARRLQALDGPWRKEWGDLNLWNIFVDPESPRMLCPKESKVDESTRCARLLWDMSSELPDYLAQKVVTSGEPGQQTHSGRRLFASVGEGCEGLANILRWGSYSVGDAGNSIVLT